MAGRLGDGWERRLAALARRRRCGLGFGRLFDGSRRGLHARGHCHSVEVYDGADLVGGLYGVSLGGAFFGESMFHRARDASKIALVHLVARLKAGGFVLLDAQFVTDHLKTFGARELARRQYHRQLEAAIAVNGRFHALPPGQAMSGAEALRRVG